jgi:hypothetical protein
MNLDKLEEAFAERLVRVGEKAGAKLPADRVVGALLAAALAIALRHADGAEVADQLRAVLDRVEPLPKLSPVDPASLN